MVEPTVSVRDLNRYFGEIKAVSGISFDVRAGQVLGFIGANGAGKTTTMRVMATLDQATSGDVKIAGVSAQHFPKMVKRKIGWMPDSYGRYPETTVFEYLDFYARAFGFKQKERLTRIADVLEFTDLSVIATREIEELSKGMAQRLCLGRMLLHDPEVLIMDEPAAGLDPKARVEFKHLVRLLAEDGKAIFISSHILSELEHMCDSILFIDQGKVIHHGSTETLKNLDAGGTVVEVKILGDIETLREWVLLNPGVEFLESVRGGCRLTLDSDNPEEHASILKKMVTDGLAVTEFRKQERRLEDAFIEILKQGEQTES